MDISSDPPRQLIWVPIIHTQADLGSLSQSIRELHIRRLGKSQWERRTQAIDDVWRQTRADIDALGLDYGKVRLYQDGLPDSGHEEEIVRDLAEAGSQNHLLLLDLLSRGARLTGTEAPALLLEEYEAARQLLVALNATRNKRPPDRRRGDSSKALLDRRDRYIAERIARTLQPGETGLVFLGMLHSLEGRLPLDINVRRLSRNDAAAPRKASSKPDDG